MPQNNPFETYAGSNIVGGLATYAGGVQDPGAYNAARVRTPISMLGQRVPVWLKNAMQLPSSLINQSKYGASGTQAAGGSSMKIGTIVVIGALLAGLLAFGQSDNTLHVKEFPGATVGAKVTAAQAACPANTSPCVIVIDASLAAFPAGTIPAACARCTVIDYRTPGTLALPSGTIAAGTVTATSLTTPILTASVNGVQNVLSWGAKADELNQTTGAMAAASSILTTTGTPVFNCSTDIGKSVEVDGAGASGVPLFTTILSCQGANAVTLSAASTTTVSSAAVRWGTDLGAVISSILTAYSGVAEIYIPAGNYILSSPISSAVEGMKIKGAGRALTNIYDAEAGRAISITSSSLNENNYGASGMEGVTLFGNPSPTAEGYYFSNLNGARIVNNTFANFTSLNAVHAQNTISLWTGFGNVANDYFNNNKVGLLMDVSGGTTAFGGWTIENNTYNLNANQIGIEGGAGGPYIYNTLISGNGEFNDPGAVGIEAVSGANFTADYIFFTGEKFGTAAGPIVDALAGGQISYTGFIDDANFCLNLVCFSGTGGENALIQGGFNFTGSVLAEGAIDAQSSATSGYPREQMRVGVGFSVGKDLAPPAVVIDENQNGYFSEITATSVIPGVLYSAAGTALPTCAVGIQGETAIVKDAASPTYMGAYTSGGGITAAVICGYNGTTYAWVTH